MQFVLIDFVRLYDDHLLTGKVTALNRIVATSFLLKHFEIELSGGAHFDFLF